MTEEELRQKLYQLKLEMAKIEYDHHNQVPNSQEKLAKLKEEYNIIKKEMVRLKFEERRKM